MQVKRIKNTGRRNLNFNRKAASVVIRAFAIIVAIMPKLKFWVPAMCKGWPTTTVTSGFSIDEIGVTNISIKAQRLVVLHRQPQR